MLASEFCDTGQKVLLSAQSHVASPSAAVLHVSPRHLPFLAVSRRRLVKEAAGHCGRLATWTSVAMSRPDGRRNDELRTISIKYEGLDRVDGSARFGFGEFMSALARKH